LTTRSSEVGAACPSSSWPHRAARTADGLIIVLVVDDIDAEYVRQAAAGTAILTPIETAEWGERCFQVEDPRRRHPARAVGRGLARERTA
jgi:uncharacterized glyoxalase superfamily protein PhnB